MEPPKEIVQQKVDRLRPFYFKPLHTFGGVSKDFKPWTCGLSPSALYNCSLSCRKGMGIKTPEVKWMSIKRWVTTTPGGVALPPGVFFSIKRREVFVAMPKPMFDKKEFVLLMFPYGNVWSQSSPGTPITEEWMWQEVDGMLILEALMRKDAANPVKGYFKACAEYAKSHPEQIGIHLKRRKGIASTVSS